MGLNIGQILGGQNVEIADTALNQHIIISGMSGSGKTVKAQAIELYLAQHGYPVLVFNYHNTHDPTQIFPDIRREYLNLAQSINMYSTGVPISLLEPLTYPDGEVELAADVAGSVVSVFDDVCRLGSSQMARLWRAIEVAIKCKDHFVNDIEAIEYGLRQQEDPVADTVWQKYWQLFSHGIFKDGSGLFYPGQVTVCDLSQFNKLSQTAMTELILSCIWRRAMVQFTKEPVYIVCDECQVLNWKKNSILPQMLREGRKFNINLILATQTYQTFSKEQRAILQQAGTKLYFAPSGAEIIGIAAHLDKEKQRLWIEKLSRLRTGQCIAEGRFKVGEYTVEKPLILSEDLGNNG